MCSSGTYWVKYKDITVPVTLIPYGTVLSEPNFQMKIGSRYIGNHWCVHCNLDKRGARIYPTHEECVGSEHEKITRTLNAIQLGASKLRGQALKDIFNREFGTSIP